MNNKSHNLRDNIDDKCVICLDVFGSAENGEHNYYSINPCNTCSALYHPSCFAKNIMVYNLNTYDDEDDPDDVITHKCCHCREYFVEDYCKFAKMILSYDKYIYKYNEKQKVGGLSTVAADNVNNNNGIYNYNFTCKMCKQ